MDICSRPPWAFLMIPSRVQGPASTSLVPAEGASGRTALLNSGPQHELAGHDAVRNGLRRCQGMLRCHGGKGGALVGRFGLRPSRKRSRQRPVQVFSHRCGHSNQPWIASSITQFGRAEFHRRPPRGGCECDCHKRFSLITPQLIPANHTCKDVGNDKGVSRGSTTASPSPSTPRQGLRALRGTYSGGSRPRCSTHLSDWVTIHTMQASWDTVCGVRPRRGQRLWPRAPRSKSMVCRGNLWQAPEGRP